MLGRILHRSPMGSVALSSGNSKFNAMLQNVRCATKKAGGSTKNGRDSPGQRLGVKRFGGELVAPGYILLRQRGQKVKHGDNTKMGRDHTIYSTTIGHVKFTYDKIKKVQTLSVLSAEANL